MQKKKYFIKVELVGLCTVLVLYTARVVSQNAAYKSVCVFSFILRPEDQWSCNAHLRSAVHEHYGIIVDLIFFEPSYNDRTSKVASGPIEDLILKANLHAWSTLAPDIKNPVDRCFSTSTQSAIKSHIALCWVCHHASHFVNV